MHPHPRVIGVKYDRDAWFDPWVGRIPLEKGTATNSSILALRIPWIV